MRARPNRPSCWCDSAVTRERIARRADEITRQWKVNQSYGTCTYLICRLNGGCMTQYERHSNTADHAVGQPAPPKTLQWDDVVRLARHGNPTPPRRVEKTE